MGTLKLCLGPLHPPSGFYLPVKTSFWRVGNPKRGTLYRSKCKECEQHLRRRYNKNPRRKSLTHVQVDRYWWIIEELFQRLGVHETCKRLGISITTFYNHRNRKFPVIKKTTVRKAILELALVRTEEQRGFSPMEAHKIRKKLQAERWQSSRRKGRLEPASATP